MQYRSFGVSLSNNSRSIKSAFVVGSWPAQFPFVPALTATALIDFVIMLGLSWIRNNIEGTILVINLSVFKNVNNRNAM
jgi:hypothetical protein